MTVRMTQSQSGTTSPSTSPYPTRQSGHPDLSELAGTDLAAPVEAAPTALETEAAPAGADPGPGPDSAVDQPPAVDHASRVEGLRAVRAERHRRRVLSLACAALVAACLVVTILIVSLARTRSSGPSALGSPATLTAVGPASIRPSVPTHPSRPIQAPRRH
jgi:hypothetical protein